MRPDKLRDQVPLSNREIIILMSMIVQEQVMKTTNARPNLTISAIAAFNPNASAVQLDGIHDSLQPGMVQSSGYNGASGFETEQRRSHSFEEARRNHPQLNGLMARIRKTLPWLSQRVARAGLRAGSAGSMRGEYAHRSIFRPVDGEHYEMLVHPIKNVLEWNFANLNSDLPMQPYFYAPRGSAGRQAQLYGQPWHTPWGPHAATGLNGQPWSHAGLAGANPAMQPGSGFQFAALQFSPFRQGQFQHSQADAARPWQRSPQRNGLRNSRRLQNATNDLEVEDDLAQAPPPAMSTRRDANQWREAVGQLQEGGMSAADMREWINDFHDCRRYPSAENHAHFNEKYATLFEGDVGAKSLHAAFDGLRRAFGAALAPGGSDAEPVRLPAIAPHAVLA